MKAQNLKVALDGEVSHADDETAPTKRLNLASARHARPPKGINNLCGAFNKGLGGSSKRPDESMQGPSLQADPATKKEASLAFTTAQRSHGSQQRGKEINEYRQRSVRRRRLKNTQLSVDINKAKNQQEFVEHRNRMA